ncbi:hypothetical protein [Paenibacillus crassostreae]|uniref:Lipoprotein n=1 Tax=Paenibacillus crassostreae TaxID=1763538 RepID=A0A162KPR2_9BACL|nr:hypothetical protein [Paenibacillus crassostreae]AOZ93009.1 hypothetical protein LPB68_12820 [Paenibacillus crassostreae]OAB71903.1 hypothetical protein PNBC_18070 [Paenibacillus crassostreae]
MYRIKNIGWVVIGTLMLMLTACDETPDSANNSQVQEQPQEQAEQPTDLSEPTEELSEQPQDEQALVDPQEGLPPTALEAATTVIKALEANDMSALADWVHPEKGLRFSPYAFVDVKTDILLTRDEIKHAMEDSQKYVWRSFPGNGDLIEMTFAEYYKRFIYDADFIKDGEIAMNEGLGESTTINNLKDVYPKDSHDFVEYYIDGIDPSVEGMDWRSLRLVFEKIGDDHALVGIIHDQWTP